MSFHPSVMIGDAPSGIHVWGDTRSLFALQQRECPDGRRPVLAPLRVNERLARALDALEGRDLERLLQQGPASCGVIRFLPADQLLPEEEPWPALGSLRETPSSRSPTADAQIDRLEAELGAFLGRHMIATSSSAGGMIIALSALGVGPGDEVLLPANSFIGTENAILACGATPVLVDSDPCDLNLDPACIEEKITRRTRAIFAVDNHGKAANVAAIRQVADTHGLKVVLDACQSLGVMESMRHADAAVYSLNVYRNFGACSKGGAIAVADLDLARRCRSSSDSTQGSETKAARMHPFGSTSRLDGTQAAVASRRLPHLTLNNLRRMLLARRYLRALEPLATRGRLLLPAFSDDRGYRIFTVQVLPPWSRDEIRRRLLERSRVETAVYYPVLTHLQPTQHHRRLFEGVSLPQVETAQARILSLPLHNNLTLASQDRVVAALEAAFA
ncbi:DegT/DnrJ/EryC1/StrS family aminotransferase [Chondromyces apiculatus]|uniref:DegT/DnrJ/EryC1/StrS aminotransferase n=1 Tax=Chondromyces apiculatus DSM 436 TaxID=1192034 RepID=A0A017SXE5_9BACT|nr:aminotransferase class I/II-fold pyridoxal phosphate-dependent enzyme [Chondromyces apiculatus]EYF00976.1 Hypothetical protein CAP_8844 [Chondromyces apiculatus DSM 436]